MDKMYNMILLRMIRMPRLGGAGRVRARARPVKARPGWATQGTQLELVVYCSNCGKQSYNIFPRDSNPNFPRTKIKNR